MDQNFRSDRLIVKRKPTANASAITNLQADIGVTKVTQAEKLGIEIWQIPSGKVEQTIAAYKNNPQFEYIEPDYLITLEDVQKTNPAQKDLGTITPQATTPNDPGYSQLWGLNNTGQSGGTPDADIDAPEAWDIQKGNPNLVIGVIDTGVDYNHPDLVGNIWQNPGEIAGDGIDNDNNGYIDDIRGWDFADNDNNPMDANGHGTHVSGTIAGKGNNGVGVTGVAWNAKIMPLKFFSDSGPGYISGAILAINYATAKGVKLTNNSWGGGGYSQALSDAINTAGQQGALFVAAAGNSSLNTDITPEYPANYDLANIISVASTTRTDGLSSFSNYGATTVDLGAPGSDIYSTWPNSTYNTISGTSMAAPHVTGAAALVWSQNPTWTAQQVKNTLMQKTDPISALAGKTVSGGRLNINNALSVTNDNLANRIVLNGVPVSTTGSNIGATGEVGEPIQNGTTNSVWWSWTAPSSNTFVVDTKGSNFDTYLSLFTGSAVNNLTLIDANDDGGGNATSLINLNATAGTTYQIAVDGYQSATGSIRLNIAPAADITPPTASSFTPADNAIAVAVGANLVVNFSEAIQKGTGNVVIKKLSDNSVVETIAVTAANISLSGSQLTINPTADLAANTDYYVEVANGAIKDIAGNNYAGITGNSTWNFQTAAAADITPPTASSFTPADNAIAVAVGANLVVNFSEAIQKGTGNVVLKKLSDNSVVETIAVTAANISLSGSQLTINPTADLVQGTDYYVEVANGAIKDLAGNNYAGITGNSTWNFQTAAIADITPPTANSFTPADNAIAVAVGANLVVNFSEAIQKGTGNVVIKKLSDNSVVETIAVTAANISLSGSQLTINPTADLAQGTDYYVEVANGAIKDLAGNNYAGITGNSTWNFQTATAGGLLQTITPDFDSATAGNQTTKGFRPNNSVGVDVKYSTSDNNSSLASSFGFKLHYNSSQLTFVNFANPGVLSTPVAATIGTPDTDTQNEDNDPATDKVINVAWLNFGGVAWPNTPLPATLYKANFTASSTYTGTNINFSSNNTSPGYSLSPTSAVLTLAPPVSLDADGNGAAQGATDGILMARNLFGFTGNTLTNGAIGTGATRTTATDIQAYLENGRTTMLDADGNGVAQGATDGILIARYLFGFTGTTLTNGAIGTGATRTTATQIQQFLSSYLPTAPASSNSTIANASGVITNSGATQSISANASTQKVAPGSSVSIDAKYSTSDNNSTLPSSFGFKLHYDSSKLNFVDFANPGVLSTPVAPTIGTPETDTQDEDNDSSTDKVINVAWLNFGGVAWPNVASPTTLYKANFTALPTFTTGNAKVNFSSKNASPGYTFQGTGAVINADTTPPIASTFTPADNATGVAVGANLVVNFSEAIKKGTGNVVIKKLSDNSVVETIAVTAANISLSGSQLTINPTADLAANTDYYVEVANGAIKDIAGNNYAGITGNSTWNFKTLAPADTTPPIASTFTPADNATAVAVGANLVVNFSEAIQKGTGNVVIKKLSDNSVVETIAVTAANISLSGSQLTINPTADLAPNTDYYVEIANGAIKDVAGNNYAGITGNSTWNFKTLVPGPINGTAGADNLTGTANADVINGLAGNDTLNGLAGNDTLDGGLGNDQLQGGLGNDTYIVDSAGDIITELAAQGTDEVLSSVTYTLPVEVENLTLTGTVAINGTGNGLANTITGNTANNTLNGGAGNDTLIGSAGNDIYVVDSAGDVVTEAANAGTDTVQSSVTYTLPVNVENLTLTGTAAINGTGNGLANTITGNTANNTIDGDAGQDTLTGSAGVDTFIFRFGQSSVSASDRITDFAIGSDKIDLLTQGGAAMNAPSSFSRAANSTATTLQDMVAQVFTDANGALAGNQAFGTNSASLVVATNASIAGTYLVINDGIAGFQASNDLIVNLTGYSGTLPPLGTITVTSFFV
ncbi:Ig-like domain-containing protein [Microcoleus sp. bin38.metabat.b11b12b14.051]|uniref:Ig-like domain-containing protein n=1 Tax=Microcoleus sp. bin38.metabat.b11b12b14.051 TaxID=2742709 RepID=UPI0025F16C10|nr:Ig-like domain-containing protein [Microcoleus sp. bin38.metabat.b11b12b14.051]